MVEGQRSRLLALPPGAGMQQVLDRRPASAVGVTARPGCGQVRGEGEVGDADHAHPGITRRVPVGGQLLQMRAVAGGRPRRIVRAQTGLLDEFARRRGPQVLVHPDEAAGQRPAALERRLSAADDQRAERVTAHREHDQVDGDSEGREGRRVVGRHAAIIVVFLTINTPFGMLVISPCPATGDALPLRAPRWV